MIDNHLFARIRRDERSLPVRLLHQLGMPNHIQLLGPDRSQLLAATHRRHRAIQTPPRIQPFASRRLRRILREACRTHRHHQCRRGNQPRPPPNPEPPLLFQNLSPLIQQDRPTPSHSSDDIANERPLPERRPSKKNVSQHSDECESRIRFAECPPGTQAPYSSSSRWPRSTGLLRTGVTYRFRASISTLIPAPDHSIAPTAGAWGPGRRVSSVIVMARRGLWDQFQRG